MPLIGDTGKADPGYSEIVTMFKKGEIKTFRIDEGGKLTYVPYADKGEKEIELSYRLLDYSIFYNDLNDVIQKQVEANDGKDVKELKSGDGVYEYTYQEPANIPWWVSYLPMLVIVVIGVIFFNIWATAIPVFFARIAITFRPIFDKK